MTDEPLHPRAATILLAMGIHLDGMDILPGFTMLIADLFVLPFDAG